MQLNSTLNQALDADIELLGVQNDDAQSIVVKLASDAVYLRMGIERNELVDKLKFTLKQNAKGIHYIKVSTVGVVKEPFLNFLIELNWSNGRLLREFTLLLDPPVLLSEAPGPVSAPRAELPQNFTTTTSSDDFSKVDIFKKTKTAEPDEQNIDRKSSNESMPESTGRSTLEELADLGPLLDEDVVPTLLSTSLQKKSLRKKVAKNDILWKIAEQLRPDNISVEQMMLALKAENPTAFYRDNISYLKAGAVLRIKDTSTLSDIPAEEAIAEISRQHQDWLAERRERMALNAVMAESTNLPSNAMAGASNGSDDFVDELVDESNVQPRLKLVSPLDERSGDAITQTNAVLEAASEKLSQLNIELAIAQETIEAGKHENEELLNRLSALEEQMSAMQSLIQLKDAELQRLQGGEAVANFRPISPLTLDVFSEENDISSGASVSRPIQSSQDELENTDLLNDSVTIATAIFSILLLVLLIWFIRGKRETHSEETEVFKVAEQQKSLDELFPTNASNKEDVGLDVDADAEKNVIKFNETVENNRGNEVEIEIEPLTDINFENTEILNENESLLDPIAEAEVYLTYEKYHKAEALLHDAIASDPKRQELKLKLLEVFALSRNIVEFDKQAEELFAAIDEDKDSPLWQHALLMVQDIDTHSTLFDSAESPEIENSELTDSHELSHSEQNPQNPKMDQLEPKMEQVPETVKEASNVAWLPDHVTAFDAKSNIISDTDIKTNDVEASAQFSDAELKDAMNSFSEEAVSKDWEAEEHASDIVNDAIENATAHSLKSSLTNKPIIDTSLFLLSDEVGTKLDLAKAYIEMGDQEGAIDLLGEVLEEGSSMQKSEAKELMESS